MTSIVGWHGGFMAGGSVKASRATEAALWSSADGSAWQRVGQGTSGFADARILQILATPTGLLALGEVPEPTISCPAAKDTLYDPYRCLSVMPTILWRSADGRTWTRVDTGGSLAEATISSIAVAGGRFVAVGYAADLATANLVTATWTSPDGSTWTRHQDVAAFEDATLSGVIAMATGFVAYGETWPVDATVGHPHLAAGIWYSADGLAWQREALPPVGYGIESAYAAAQGAVAVSDPCSPLAPCTGGSPNLWSSDGRTWTSLPDGTIHEPFGAEGGVGAAFGTDGSRIVATGGARAGQIQVSLDSQHWRDVSGSSGPPTTPGTWLIGVGPSSLVVVTTLEDGGPLSLWLASARP